MEKSVAQFRSIMITGALITAALVVFFAFWTYNVFSSEEHLQFDLTIIDIVQGTISDSLTVVMKIITEVGYIYVIFPIMLVMLAYLIFKKKHYWEALMLAASLGGGDVIKVTIKKILQRERPIFNPLVEESGFSFPSGHSMAAMTFYGMLAYILWLQLPKGSIWRKVIVIVTPLVIFVVGISRIYLGVHYPSDIIAGYTVGGAWLITCMLALNAIRHYKGNGRAQAREHK